MHHVITCTLLSVSWVNCNWRIGTLVLVSHDLNDILLEVTKMLVYLRASPYDDYSFLVFISFWILTRLIYFPFGYVFSLRLCLVDSCARARVCFCLSPPVPYRPVHPFRVSSVSFPSVTRPDPTRFDPIGPPDPTRPEWTGPNRTGPHHIHPHHPDRLVRRVTVGVGAV